MRLSPSRQAELETLFARPFAHRGLHGRGIVENSLSAFEAAIEAGHGIELDVQRTLDGLAVVFHDYALDRLTDAKGRIDALRLEELESIPLKGSGDRIASLERVLEYIAGRAPLLIEIKARNQDYRQLCTGVLHDLHIYSGPVAVMSFNPRVGHWFARNGPETLRGLVVSEEGKHHLRGRMERHLSLWWARPDFLAYDIRDLPSRFAGAQRAKGLKVGTWTVRSDGQRATAAAEADQIIYEVQA